MVIRISRKNEGSMGLVELLFQTAILFLAVFNPPILSFNCIHIIAIFSWAYILLHYQYFSKRMSNNRLFQIYVVLVILGIYQLIVALLAGNSYVIVSNYVFWIFEVIPYGIALTTHFNKHNYDFDELLRVIIFACLLQSLMAIGALIIPNLKTFFIQKIINYGYSNVHVYLSLYRNYGFADSLTFASSLVQAIVASICLYLYIDSRKIKYLFVYVISGFAAIINTRSAIVILLVGIVVTIVTLRGGKVLLRGLWVFVLIILAVSLGLNIIRVFNDWTYNWVMDGIREIFAFMTRDSSNYGVYFNYVSSSSNMPLPHGIGVLTGLGTEIMHQEVNGVQSDIGYINDIWRIGIVASIAIYILYTTMIDRIRKTSLIEHNCSRFLSLFLLFAAALINIKGYFFVYNNITTLIWIIYIFTCCQKDSVVGEEVDYA